jgi:PUA-domain protein
MQLRKQRRKAAWKIDYKIYIKMQLRNKDLRDLNKEIEDTLGVPSFFNKKDTILTEDNLIIKENKVLFFYFEKSLVPSLHTILKNPNMLPKVTIDMPAIPFIMKGADIMRPGITEFEEFEKGDFVTIVDENNKKSLAVGKMFFSSEEMKELSKGKAVLNLHRVGDEIWNHQ